VKVTWSPASAKPRKGKLAQINPEPLHVVGAIILRAGRILLARRLPGGPHGGLWEFPGGKVEQGEEPRQALKRELDEELGVAVRVGWLCRSVTHAYSHRTIRLDVYWCRLLGGEPKPLECEEVLWVKPWEIADFDMPEADAPIAELLKKTQRD
jgi:mutator protein MutT